MRGQYAIALGLALGLTPAAWGQIHGVPASVTSSGGSHGMNPGVAASVTSTGPHGWSSPGWSGPRSTFHSGFQPSFHHGFRPGPGHHRPRSFFPFVSWGWGQYYLPYYDYEAEQRAAYEAEQAAARAQEDAAERERRDRELQRTIEDLRAYDEQRDRELAAERAAREAAPPPPVAAEPATILVFKDGRRTEVQNYAIMGDTLYLISGGRSRKVPLSELDLGATTKANEENGVDFRLPAPRTAG